MSWGVGCWFQLGTCTDNFAPPFLTFLSQEAFLTFDKVKTLIKDLLAIEAWRSEVLPKLIKDVANNNNVMRVYFTLYHEATLVNLLEVMLFHKHVLER